MPFRETLVGPRWLAAAGAATLVFLVAVTVISAPVVISNASDVGGWTIALLIAAFFLVLGAGLIGLTRRIHIAVSDSHINARLATFRVMHTPVAQVESCKIANVSPAQAGGLGWRVVGSKRFVLWSAGPAVWVKLSDGTSRVLRTEHSRELQAAIEAAASTSQASSDF